MRLKPATLVIIATLLILTFMWLTRELVETAVYKLDLDIRFWVYSLRSPFWTQIMKIISDVGMFGGIFVIGFVSAHLFYHKKNQILISLLFCSIGASIFTAFLKLIIARDRPELASRMVTETGFSFPSGHATTAFTAFGVLAITIYFSSKIPLFPKFLTIILLLVFACLVGFSRLYLGVHYFSDVVAGAFIGLSSSYIFYYFKSKHN